MKEKKIDNRYLNNRARSKQQYDHAMVASEGFMINFCSILLKLCAPFTNTSDLNQQVCFFKLYQLFGNSFELF